MLIIDTSENGKIRLRLFDKEIEVMEKAQAAVLPAAVDKILKEASAKITDIKSVAVVVGPGSFTGIRVGIAYAKGFALGLSVPVIPVNKFEVYLYKNPTAFVAIDSGRSDLFVAAHDLKPGTMDIELIETKQMEYSATVGHVPYQMKDVEDVASLKLKSGDLEPAIPMYLRPSYAEMPKCSKL